jgi:ubiquinone/menaquinone biosynthesis C-methylase UbiE
LEYGILACSCGRFPVVAGIPILKKDSTGLVERVIALIEAGRWHEALLVLMPLPDPIRAPAWLRPVLLARVIRRLKRLANQQRLRRRQEQVIAILTNQEGQATVREVFNLYFSNQKNNRDYFTYRFGQPRHLVALSFINLIHQPEKPILDLACGSGHLTFSLGQRAKGQLVVGVDQLFFGLYVAKHWIAPEAEYVCCVADSSLPFVDNAFSVAFCADAFHYFAHKTTCFRELERLTADDGLIMLIWIHNSHVRMPHDGLPLPPESYQALANNLPHRLVGNSIVLQRYLQKQGPSLAQVENIDQWRREPLLSLVASRRPEIFQEYGSFKDWPHIAGHMRLNPLYMEEKNNGSGKTHWRRVFPSTFFEEDHAESKLYLPETVELSVEVLTALAEGKRTPEMENLIERCVILGMPERYG